MMWPIKMALGKEIRMEKGWGGVTVEPHTGFPCHA